MTSARGEVVAPDLAELDRRFRELADRPLSGHVDGRLAIAACAEALEAARCGNYGVGAVLVDPAGEIVERGQNRGFWPHFRSDLHAEMVLMNAFEDARPELEDMRGYTMVTSLEPCPMCLARLLIAGVEVVKFVADDSWGGMVSRMDRLPPAWRKLAERTQVSQADAPKDLRQLACDLFELNLDRLRHQLWMR